MLVPTSFDGGVEQIEELVKNLRTQLNALVTEGSLPGSDLEQAAQFELDFVAATISLQDGET